MNKEGVTVPGLERGQPVFPSSHGNKQAGAIPPAAPVSSRPIFIVSGITLQCTEHTHRLLMYGTHMHA